jgi:hypothetical protein
MLIIIKSLTRGLKLVIEMYFMYCFQNLVIVGFMLMYILRFLMKYNN